MHSRNMQLCILLEKIEAKVAIIYGVPFVSKVRIDQSMFPID